MISLDFIFFPDSEIRYEYLSLVEVIHFRPNKCSRDDAISRPTKKWPEAHER